MANEETTLKVESILESIMGMVELEECGLRRANQLLAAGFTLLHIDGKSWEAPRRQVPPGQPDGTTFIRRDFKYVIGRREIDPPFPPDERRNGG